MPYKRRLRMRSDRYCCNAADKLCSSPSPLYNVALAKMKAWLFTKKTANADYESVSPEIGTHWPDVTRKGLHMLTISLDEYGDFEGLKGVNEPVYIGGLIYDDHGADREEHTERKRVRAYYEAVIADAAGDASDTRGFTYPEALHSDGDRAKDHNVVRPVKDRVSRSIAEFIRYGTYNGRKLKIRGRNGAFRDFQDRKGEYYVFVILKSDTGLSALLNQNANILAKDDYASNLYFHMADELICRLMFYNPLIDNIDEIAFDIATRRSALLASDSRLFQEYKAQGYKAEQAANGQFQFRLTNPDIYRSVIAEEILDAERPDIRITSFNVDSIGYHRWDSDGMEFLYMADSICSVLGFNIEGSNAEGWLKCIVQRTQELTGKRDNLVFGYDEIDKIYSKAWNKCEEGDYYKALSIAFDAGKREGAFAAYYKDVWFKRLEERIADKADVSGFNMAVRKLGETLNNNNLDPEKCFYILSVLERMAPKVEPLFRSTESKKILYTLYDIGVSACCHIGDSRRAEEYFGKCTACASLVSLEDYLNTRNKLVVFCTDYFDLDRAEELSDENVSYQELLTDLKKDLKLPGTEAAGFEALGKAYSQRGQVYAFKREQQAEGEFRKALKLFAPGSANYKITQSYLLHYYLDTGNREAYMAESVSYFDGKVKLSDQLKYIIDEGSKNDPLVNMRYALYVFVRALYIFRKEELTEKFIDRLKGFEAQFGKRIKVRDFKLTGHPAEIIFKYMCLIAIAVKDSEWEQQCEAKLHDCLRYYGVTEDVIRKFGEIEIEDAKGDAARRDELSEELIAELAARFRVFTGIDRAMNGEERYQWLKAHVTYMYC